jgi:hypothetical protein
MSSFIFLIELTGWSRSSSFLWDGICSGLFVLSIPWGLFGLCDLILPSLLFVVFFESEFGGSLPFDCATFVLKVICYEWII